MLGKFRRCPKCESSNPVETAVCRMCGTDVQAILDAQTVAASQPAQASPIQNWSLDVASLLGDSAKLYLRTLPHLARIATLTLIGALVLLVAIGLAAGFLGQFYLIAVMLMGAPGAALLLGFSGSALILALTDLCRGRTRSGPDLLAAGFVRGVTVGSGLALAAGVGAVVMVTGVILRSPLPGYVLDLSLAVLAVLAFPLLPVLVLEVKPGTEALTRACSLTAGHRATLLVLVLLQTLLLNITWMGASFLYATASGAGNLTVSSLWLVASMLLAFLIGAAGITLAFVFYWKATRGQNLAFYEE